MSETSQRVLPDHSLSSARRAVVSGTLGSALEWTDFAVYGSLSATVFPKLFFNSLDPAMGLIASFSTFGVGFLARPIGGVVFGRLGDRVGRRKILFATIFMMGISSLLIGLLPTYATIGIWAPVLLVILRFFQGFSVGGEATGSQVLTVEHAPSDRRAFYSGMMALGSPISQVASSLLLVVLTTTLSDQSFLSWGWRVPFFLSVFLVGVGLYIRLRVDETPVYLQEVDAPSEPIPSVWRVLRTRWGIILRLLLAYAPLTITFYLVTVFGLSYMEGNRGLSSKTAFTVLLVANSLAIFAVVLGAKTAEWLGRRTAMLIGTSVCLLCGILFFLIVNMNLLLLTFVIVAVASCAVQFGAAAQPALFAEYFPTSERYTGSALAYTGVNLVFASPTPFAAAAIMTTDAGTLGITVAWVGIMVIAVINLALLREPKSLEGTVQTFGRRRRAASLGKASSGNPVIR